MVSEDGAFLIELEYPGVPGVVEPSVAVVRGTLSPGALDRFRRFEAQRTVATAAMELKAAVRRRLEKRGRGSDLVHVKLADFRE
jgi:hypothetical protein